MLAKIFPLESKGARIPFKVLLVSVQGSSAETIVFPALKKPRNPRDRLPQGSARKQKPRQ